MQLSDKIQDYTIQPYQISSNSLKSVRKQYFNLYQIIDVTNKKQQKQYLQPSILHQKQNLESCLFRQQQLKPITPVSQYQLAVSNSRTSINTSLCGQFLDVYKSQQLLLQQPTQYTIRFFWRALWHHRFAYFQLHKKLSQGIEPSTNDIKMYDDIIINKIFEGYVDKLSRQKINQFIQNYIDKEQPTYPPNTQPLKHNYLTTRIYQTSSKQALHNKYHLTKTKTIKTSDMHIRNINWQNPQLRLMVQNQGNRLDSQLGMIDVAGTDRLQGVVGIARGLTAGVYGVELQGKFRGVDFKSYRSSSLGVQSNVQNKSSKAKFSNIIQKIKQKKAKQDIPQQLSPSQAQIAVKFNDPLYTHYNKYQINKYLYGTQHKDFFNQGQQNNEQLCSKILKKVRYQLASGKNYDIQLILSELQFWKSGKKLINRFQLFKQEEEEEEEATQINITNTQRYNYHYNNFVIKFFVTALQQLIQYNMLTGRQYPKLDLNSFQYISKSQTYSLLFEPILIQALGCIKNQLSAPGKQHINSHLVNLQKQLLKKSNSCNSIIFILIARILQKQQTNIMNFQTVQTNQAALARYWLKQLFNIKQASFEQEYRNITKQLSEGQSADINYIDLNKDSLINQRNKRHITNSKKLKTLINKGLCTKFILLRSISQNKKNKSGQNFPSLIQVDQSLGANCHISDLSPSRHQYVLSLRYKMMKLAIKILRFVSKDKNYKWSSSAYLQSKIVWVVMLLVATQLRQILRPEDQAMLQDIQSLLCSQQIDSFRDNEYYKNLIKCYIQIYTSIFQYSKIIVSKLLLINKQINKNVKNNQQPQFGDLNKDSWGNYQINYSKSVSKIVMFMYCKLWMDTSKKVVGQNVEYWEFIIRILLLSVIKVDQHSIFWYQYNIYHDLSQKIKSIDNNSNESSKYSNILSRAIKQTYQKVLDKKGPASVSMWWGTISQEKYNILDSKEA